MKRLLAAGLAALAVDRSPSQGAAAQTTLRFGKIPSTVRNVGSLYLYVAERKGFFAREGIKLESVLIEGGTDRMVAAIDDGQGRSRAFLDAVSDLGRAQRLASGRDRGRGGQSGLHADRPAGDHELRRSAAAR